MALRIGTAGTCPFSIHILILSRVPLLSDVQQQTNSLLKEGPEECRYEANIYSIANGQEVLNGIRTVITVKRMGPAESW